MNTIAVVITSHNYGQYIGRCLESVMTQSLPADEVVVVDDSSSDDTEVVVREFPGARYHRVELGNGNRARNFGFGHCSSEYVVFFDADNYMHEDFLKALHGGLAAHPDFDFAYCDRYMFGEGDVSWYPLELGERKSGPFDAAFLKRTNYIDTASLIRAEKFPGFDEDLRRCQDWDLWLNIVCLHGGKGFYVEQPLLYFRIHGDNLTRNEERHKARWYVGRKYQLNWFFKVPFLRNSPVAYRAYGAIRQALVNIEPVRKLKKRILPGRPKRAGAA